MCSKSWNVCKLFAVWLIISICNVSKRDENDPKFVFKLLIYTLKILLLMGSMRSLNFFIHRLNSIGWVQLQGASYSLYVWILYSRINAHGKFQIKHLWKSRKNQICNFSSITMAIHRHHNPFTCESH